MKTRLAALLVLMSALPAGAQTTPFDMSTERPAQVEPADPLSPLPTPAEAAAVQPQEAPARRYLVPSSELVLSGESARRSWSFFLTPEQAAAKTSFHIGYQNAIVIAPEASRLRVSINGTRVIDAPVASSDNASDLSAEVPSALLHAGMNDIVIETEQRHRTDCTIQSTYELWTQIETGRTFLSFEEPGANRWRRAEDIRAIGVDENGATTFNLIVPSMEQSASTPGIMRLAESLALFASMPNQSFSISASGSAVAKPGSANVVVGPAGTLKDTLAALPSGAETAPTIALVDDVRLGRSVLVVTGPDWPAVEAAVETVAKQVDRPVATQRTSLGTRLWRLPDVPIVFDATRLRFSDLGVATKEFAGRRMRTDFSVGIPSDFYANSYGVASIQLDAAFSRDVLPGSHVDVYVNDNIASTLPITSTGGQILRHLPIKVTMRHFRPGDNIISIEAVLLTSADAVCAPGATALDNRRFVLFGSSEFVMPKFARIARTPNLSAIGGTGFPYNRAEQPVPLIVDRAQPEALAAAATLLARMSVSAGRLIPVDVSASVAAVADRDALFVGPISQVASAVLGQVGIAADSRSTWGDPVASVNPDSEVTLDDWRDRMSGTGLRERLVSFEDWMNRTFNISTDSFRLFDGPPVPFAPEGNVNLVMAQQPSPVGTGVWTLLTAPTGASLEEGMRSLASQANWRQLGGRITTFDSIDTKMSSLPTGAFSFVETQPFSFSNYRLIVANWLSANVLFYAMALTALCLLLGLATAGLMSSLGRRK